MKYGIALLLWAAGMDDSMLPRLENLKKIGFDGVEVPILDLEADHWASWGRRLRDMGLECTAGTAHGPEADPLSPNPEVQARALANMKRALDCSEAVGATVLTGPFHSALGVFTGEGPTQEEWDRSVQYMRQVADYAAPKGIMIGVEFLNWFECYLLNTAADDARYIRDVDRPNCKIHYDTFHAHIEERNIARSILDNAKEIGYWHIAENDRGHREPAPSNGTLPSSPSTRSATTAGSPSRLSVSPCPRSLPQRRSGGACSKVKSSSPATVSRS